MLSNVTKASTEVAQYLDLGTGLLVLQAIMAVGLGFLFMLRVRIKKVIKWIIRKK